MGDVAALQCPRGNVINEMMRATPTACNYLNLTRLRDTQRESTSGAGKYEEASPELQHKTEELNTHPEFHLSSSSLLLHTPSPVCKVKKTTLSYSPPAAAHSQWSEKGLV